MSDELIRPRPVIVVHLDTEEGARLTACTGDPFIPDEGVTWLNVPRVPCTGCMLADRWRAERQQGGVSTASRPSMAP